MVWAAQWQERRYRRQQRCHRRAHALATGQASQCVAAHRSLWQPGMQVKSDYTRLGAPIAVVEHPGFQRPLVRRLAQWRDTPAEAVIAAARMALQLEPGCAQAAHRARWTAGQ